MDKNYCEQDEINIDDVISICEIAGERIRGIPMITCENDKWECSHRLGSKCAYYRIETKDKYTEVYYTDKMFFDVLEKFDALDFIKPFRNYGWTDHWVDVYMKKYNKKFKDE